MNEHPCVRLEGLSVMQWLEKKQHELKMVEYLISHPVALINLISEILCQP